MGTLFGGGGGGGGPQIMQINTPAPDPDIVEQRAQLKMKADATAQASADRSAQDTVARSMGMRGARSLFTGTAAGYRTLGGANV
jgi:hypothetical protein